MIAYKGETVDTRLTVHSAGEDTYRRSVGL